MRQIICNLKTGEILLENLPCPSVEDGHVLISTQRTVVSKGTEKMLVHFGKASLFQKARSQPSKVRQVFSKIKTEGLFPTVEAVFRKLDEPIPLGYSNAGFVIGIGKGVAGFKLGDRVASNGPHAEVVSVPQNLVAKIPDNVSDDAAAFTVIGAIGLQAIRLAKPDFGEMFVVVGLGLIGQITAQLLRANGCRVIGFDFDSTKVDIARSLGINAKAVGKDQDPVKEVIRMTSGVGCDGVIITASTKSNQVISQAAQMSRKRGRIILVGIIGLDLDRSEFYEKELTFQVSCSYGPGRYDDIYEEKGFDYPLAFVRWTENRNFQAVLEAMASRSLRVEPLITQRVGLEAFGEIYNTMDGDALGSMLVYGGEINQVLEFSTDGYFAPSIDNPQVPSPSMVKLRDWVVGASNGALAIVGAGNFTKMTALPACAAAKVPIKAIVSATGSTGTALAKKYGIPFSCTNYSEILDDNEVKGVIITTRHNLHAMQTVEALKAGKRVLVEKPLCLTSEELKTIENVINNTNGGASVSVGFNRRFSSHSEKMRELLRMSSAPVSIVSTINAGVIPLKHWIHDPEVGGGRLVGEACHFIDLAIFLTGSLISEVSASEIDGASDCASILLRHANGSISVVNYIAIGNRDISKERIEAHSDGRSLLLDNFRELKGLGFRSFSSLKTKQDKGHGRQFSLFGECLRIGGPPLIPWVEIANGARATLAVPLAIKERRWVSVSEV